MANVKRIKGSWLEWTSDRIFRIIVTTLKLLPYRQRVAAMDRITRILLGTFSDFLKRSERHLKMVFPDMPEAERRQLARRALGNAGRAIIELYSVKDMNRAVLNSEISGPGLDLALQAAAEGRPVIFLTGHFGNNDAPRHALVAKGLQVGGLYRAMSNPYFNSHYVRTITSVSGPAFEQGPSGTRHLLRHLKQGGMVMMLFDVWVKEGEPIDFMGFPADTSLAAASFAQRTNALVIPFFGIRNPDGVSFDIRIEAPLEQADPLTMMREATARLEAQIRAHPEQYFWVHRRWKPL